MTSQEFFEKNHYLKLSNIIPRYTADFLYSYVILAAKRLAVLHEKLGKGNYNENRWGTFEDEQAPGDYSSYGDLTFDTLLGFVKPEIENAIGIDLTPTYSYHRLYTTDTELERHTDRESCEISATVCLGYNVKNMDVKKYPDYDWPMYVKGIDNKDQPVHLKPGEMLIYRGCKVEHWREPFPGLNHAQAFIHYNETNKIDNDDNEFDKRWCLGLPHISNPIEPNFKKSFSLNDTATADDKFKWIIE